MSFFMSTSLTSEVKIFSCIPAVNVQTHQHVCCHVMILTAPPPNVIPHASSENIYTNIESCFIITCSLDEMIHG